MKNSNAILNLFKVILLTGVLFVLFATIYPLVGVGQDLPEPHGDPTQAALILLACCFLQVVCVSLLVLRSRWSGWRLISAIFIIWVLGSTILGQMDSLWFMSQISLVFVGKLVLATSLQAALFSIIVVWVLGHGRQAKSETRLMSLIHRSGREWLRVFLTLALLHIVLYFTCGYYIAWQSPELRQFYGGSDPGSFYLQMLSLVKSDPWLFPFQLLRGLIWGLVVVLLSAALVGSRLSAALISTFVVVALFSAMLALPNPLMPEAVRHAHLLETVVSRGLFAFLSVWYLRTG